MFSVYLHYTFIFMNESQIIEQAQKGSQTALHQIYLAHVGYMQSVCSRYILCDEEVKDVMQESFIKIFSNIKSFKYRGTGSLRSWMTRIMINEALRTIKQKMHTLEIEDVMADVAEYDTEDASEVPPDAIHEMIRELPQGYRTVLNLYIFEEYSHKEIAAMLGISELTSASQLHRAKKLLKKNIIEYKKKQ